jgi:hypothetical protein
VDSGISTININFPWGIPSESKVPLIHVMSLVIAPKISSYASLLQLIIDSSKVVPVLTSPTIIHIVMVTVKSSAMECTI